MAEIYPKRLENTLGKGEIARYEQFLLFPQCFQKACFPGASKGVIVWEWVKLPFFIRARPNLMCILYTFGKNRGARSIRFNFHLNMTAVNHQIQILTV